MLQGCTALLLAVQYEAEGIASTLLEHGADVNTLKYEVGIHSINWIDQHGNQTLHSNHNHTDKYVCSFACSQCCCRVAETGSHAPPPAHMLLQKWCKYGRLCILPFLFLVASCKTCLVC